MMKLGIRTGKAHPPLETSASLGEGSGEDPTFMVRERDGEPGQAFPPEGLVLVGAGEPYRPRHAADAVQEPLDSSELPTEPQRGRHQR